MAKYKWHKHRKIDPNTIWTAPENGEYTVTFSGDQWTASPTFSTISTPTSWEVSSVIGSRHEPVSIPGFSRTILENTITIPYEAIEAVGSVEEFVNTIIPDGYLLLEYNMDMEYSTTDQSRDVVTLHYRAEQEPLIAVNSSAYGTDDSVVVDAGGTALTQEVLEEGFAAATANFGTVRGMMADIAIFDEAG